MFIQRDLERTLDRYRTFPVIAIVGSRQSGKTTFSRAFFSEHAFVSLEDPTLREFARSDPKGF